MNIEEIKQIIPHRNPMLLVDEVAALKPMEYIETKFYVDPSREIFKGHFPDEPVLPGVYSIEIMAQTADLLIMTDEKYQGKIPLLIAVDEVCFGRRPLCHEWLKDIYYERLCSGHICCICYDR